MNITISNTGGNAVKVVAQGVAVSESGEGGVNETVVAAGSTQTFSFGSSQSLVLRELTGGTEQANGSYLGGVN